MHVGRILITSFSIYPSFSRQSKILDNIINALSPRFVADVLTVRENIMGYIEKVKNNRILRVPINGKFKEKVAGFQRAVSRQLDDDDYDIIHFRSPWEGKIISELKDQLTAKFIYEPTVTLPYNASDDVKADFIEYEKISMEIADAVLIPHGFNLANLSYFPENTPFIEYSQGVDINLFDKEETVGLSNFDLILIDNFSNFGSIEPVLSAIKEVRSTRPRVKLAMVGPMTDKVAEFTKKKLNQFELSKNIRFFGTHPENELALLINRAQTALVAPRFSSIGIIPRDTSLNLLEYMACGVPVVAPFSRYINEITQNGDLATLYSPVDTRSFAKAISASLEQRDLVLQKAQDAYFKVRNQHNASISRRKIIKIYAQLISPVIQDEQIEFKKTSARSGITWTGTFTSNTGPGLPYPVASDLAMKPEDFYETDTLNIEFEDLEFEDLELDNLEFEAKGTLLGFDPISSDDVDSSLQSENETKPFKPSE